MAKKETKTAEAPATAAAPAAAKTDAVTRGQDDLFCAVFEGGKPKEPTGKLAPQAKVIINTIVAAGAGGIRRKDLSEKLPAAGLVTTQPPGRIVTYYQKTLLSSGAVTITKSTPVPAAPAAATAPAAK